MSVRGIISRSNVRVICTTDDPGDDLIWHEKIAADPTCTVRVLPAFRPDKAMNADKPGYGEYIKTLSEAVGFTIDSFDALCRALSARVEYFAAHGCVAADHGLDAPVYADTTAGECEGIFARALRAPVSAEDGEKFKTAILLHLAGEYARRGWVMQLHMSCLRNTSTKMLREIGADAGYDAIGGGDLGKVAALLNAMEQSDTLPKCILYSLNPADNAALCTIAGSFNTDSPVPMRVQPGAAWWFNDNHDGMRRQLTDLANMGVLGAFVGMLTDSRSFLSYTRHEYFRRILCELIGGWAQRGEVWDDEEELGGIVRDICYYNAERYFGFGV
jgi:glucuronate isomerase